MGQNYSLFLTVYLLRKLVNAIKECFFLTAISEVMLHGSEVTRRFHR